MSTSEKSVPEKVIVDFGDGRWYHYPPLELLPGKNDDPLPENMAVYIRADLAEKRIVELEAAGFRLKQDILQFMWDARERKSVTTGTLYEAIEKWESIAHPSVPQRVADGEEESDE